MLVGSGKKQERVMEKATVYYASMLGVRKIEGRLVDFGTRKYAQYDNAPFVSIIPKRKRKARCVSGDYEPYILLLKGHGHPDLDVYEPAEPSTTPGVMVRRAKYSACDPQWGRDADTKLDHYIETSGVEVLADYRSTKGFNSHNRFQGV